MKALSAAVCFSCCLSMLMVLWACSYWSPINHVFNVPYWHWRPCRSTACLLVPERGVVSSVSAARHKSAVISSSCHTEPADNALVLLKSNRGITPVFPKWPSSSLAKLFLLHIPIELPMSRGTNRVVNHFSNRSGSCHIPVLGVSSLRINPSLTSSHLPSYPTIE